jgi:hypothetical protein
MPLFNKVMVGARDLSRTNRFKLRNACTTKAPIDSFSFASVAAEACARAGTSVTVTSPETCPDGAGWEKLCKAIGNEHGNLSNLGSQLLRERLVHSLSQRLGLEELYKNSGDQIAQSGAIVEPIMLIGLPRSYGRYGAHLMGRTGNVRALRTQDTAFPCTVAARERRLQQTAALKKFLPYFPDLRGVQPMESDMIANDVQLHLLTPYSLAWGLLHGLDDYLYECLEVDQQPVFENVKRVLSLFQWFETFEEFEPALVDRHFEVICKTGEDLRWEKIDPNPKRSWFLHSPFAILAIDKVHATFPDMGIVWVHRALSQCVPSLCSVIAMHRSVYFNRLPTETNLANIGDQILGIFSSGTEAAVDYLADFPRQRMVHWSNRDLRRHGSRILSRTCPRFGLAWEKEKNIRCANAQVENDSLFRPLHDAPLHYFAVHEGRLNEAFKVYINQFEEYAFEPKFGITIEKRDPLVTGSDETVVRFGQPGSSRGSIASGVPEHAAPAGHFLQESDSLRRF